MSQFTQGPTEPVLKPRDLGQLLDQSFKVFGRSWKPLVLIGLIAAIPGLLWSIFSFFLFSGAESGSLAGSWYFDLILGLANGDLASVGTLIMVGLLVFVVFLLLGPLYSGALIDVSARAVLNMPSVPLGESFRVASTRYFALLGTSALKVIVYFFTVIVSAIAGLLIFAIITVPAGLLVVSVFFLFTAQVVMIEGTRGGFAAFGRSFRLAKSRFWSLTGFTIVFFLMVYIIQGIIVMPISLSTGIFASFTGNFAAMSLLYLVQALVQAVVVPFTTVGMTLAYFDARVRREGFDLEVQAQQQADIGQTGAGPTGPWSGLGQSASGQSAYGQATSGQSTSGQPTPGQSTPGQSAYGQATSGQSTSGQSTPGQSTSGQSTRERDDDPWHTDPGQSGPLS